MTYYGSQMVVEALQHYGSCQSCSWRAPFVTSPLNLGPRAFACTPSRRARWRRAPPPEFRNSTTLLDKAKAKAPARSLVSIDDVGMATAFLAHDAARLITGETLYIDGGYHIMD